MVYWSHLIQSAHVRSKRQYIEILHGTKYADYYLRINSAQSLSLSLLVFVLSFFVYGLTAEPVVLVVMFVMAAAIYYYYDTLPKAKVEKRTEEISHADLGIFPRAERIPLITDMNHRFWIPVRLV